MELKHTEILRYAVQRCLTMPDETDSLKKLTESFFKSLKCEVIWNDKILFVNKVPNDFEKLFGKRAPYNFVFNIKDLQDENELITKGSSLIKLIAIYLDNKAQTTLLKIKFNLNFKEEVMKHINFSDYDIINIVDKHFYDYIYRFTFISILQYLNEKEQIITPIYVHDKSIVENFNIDLYETVSGTKDDVFLDLVKDQYLISKERLKKILEPKIANATYFLNKSLEKEIKRVDSHYINQVGEIYKEIENSEEKIKELISKLSGKSSDENKKLFTEKIERLKQNIIDLKDSGDLQKFEKEKEFLTNDEKHKHSLNITNNLMNTTIIYYPIFNLRMSIRKKGDLGLSKEIKFDYNPLTKKLSPLTCEGCSKEIHEINICSFNHLSCKNCLSKCSSCFKQVCNDCKKTNCTICSLQLCNKCHSLCSICQKYSCKSHTCRDSISGKNLCTNCAEYCFLCGKYSAKSNFKKCDNCRSNVCIRCLKTKMINGKSRVVCS